MATDEGERPRSKVHDLLDNKGTPLNKQSFTWRDLAGKLDDDALTRVRVILMTRVESKALRLKHFSSRFHKKLQLPPSLRMSQILAQPRAIALACWKTL